MSDIYYHGPVVAFDLDDTLFPEREFCRSGFRHILQRVVEESREDIYKKMCKALKSRENPFEPYADHIYNPILHGADRESWLKSVIEEYRNHIPEALTLEPDAEELLHKLKESGVKMALVTDGRSNTQRRKIDALGLKQFIPEENLYISEEVGEDKLNPRSFGDIVRKYPEARAFYYVGNNEKKDFLQPNLLGWTTIKVSPRHDAVHPDYINPDPIGRPTYVVDDIREVLQTLNIKH